MSCRKLQGQKVLDFREIPLLLLQEPAKAELIAFDRNPDEVPPRAANVILQAFPVAPLIEATVLLAASKPSITSWVEVRLLRRPAWLRTNRMSCSRLDVLHDIHLASMQACCCCCFCLSTFCAVDAQTVHMMTMQLSRKPLKAMQPCQAR